MDVIAIKMDIAEDDLEKIIIRNMKNDNDKNVKIVNICEFL